ncbi:hypothetical protein M8994_18425 [Brucella sp. 21LCYQ03]|nr:hypothetical protein [Brucella sp. 21LCYQ03]
MNPFHQVESPACDAVCAASILLELIHEHFSESHQRSTGSDRLFSLNPQERDNLLFAAGLVSNLAQKTKAAFYAACEADENGGAK